MTLRDAPILILATWRLTSLLVNEHGPWDLLRRLRERVGVAYWPEDVPDVGGQVAYVTNTWAGGLACFWCASVWVGPVVLVCWWVCRPLVVVLAISGGAILTESIISGRSQHPDPPSPGPLREGDGD